ncbi:hypothetical protein DFH05DRAFT_1153229 [Lentinula detonsa]|uniref:Uncharacterized protein n=1 Tax=Lentinula detonsa TaxID=2804962 RepID=A0A9W8NZZ3_9AGAR|nr:hypothetical protein DFH05DRAFT_1153229 [Lentinula detonsa]
MQCIYHYTPSVFHLMFETKTKALRRAQVNALKSIYPEIDTDDAGYKLPQGAKDMGEGLVVLRPRSSKLHWGTGREQFLLQGQFGNNPVCQWGRLCLPNGQIARSRFCEVDLFRKRKPRHTRNVQLWYSGVTTMPSLTPAGPTIISRYFDFIIFLRRGAYLRDPITLRVYIPHT